MDTNQQYHAIITQCKNIFMKKYKDYGTAWRVLRPISIVDQIYIKAKRIKNIQMMQNQKVQDSVQDEYIGIINYCIIGLMQLDFTEAKIEELEQDIVSNLYTKKSEWCYHIMLDKNHDYGEAWREMDVISLLDLILMKIIRMKQIIKNKQQTLISEGLDANLVDMLVYAVFSLILLNN